MAKEQQFRGFLSDRSWATGIKSSNSSNPHSHMGGREAPALGNLDLTDPISHFASILLRRENSSKFTMSLFGTRCSPSCCKSPMLLPGSLHLKKSQKLLVPAKKSQKALEEASEITQYKHLRPVLPMTRLEPFHEDSTQSGNKAEYVVNTSRPRH